MENVEMKEQITLNGKTMSVEEFETYKIVLQENYGSLIERWKIISSASAEQDANVPL